MENLPVAAFDIRLMPLNMLITAFCALICSTGLVTTQSYAYNSAR